MRRETLCSSWGFQYRPSPCGSSVRGLVPLQPDVVGYFSGWRMEAKRPITQLLKMDIRVILFVFWEEAPWSSTLDSDEQCGVGLREEGPRSVG